MSIQMHVKSQSVPQLGSVHLDDLDQIQHSQISMEITRMFMVGFVQLAANPTEIMLETSLCVTY